MQKATAVLMSVVLALGLSVHAADIKSENAGDYRAVRVGELPQHVGKQVRISMPRGVVREGTLAEANPSTITVEQHYRRGLMKFDVLTKQVEKAEVRD